MLGAILKRSVAIFGLVLCGLVFLTACAPSQRKVARDKATLLADSLTPPANVVLLFEDVGISKPDHRGCWAVYVDRVHGIDESTAAVLSHYTQILENAQGWIKNSVIVGDDIAVYDHPDGSSVHISTDIIWDFPREYEKYHTRFTTLFYQIIVSRPLDVRERCREY